MASKTVFRIFLFLNFAAFLSCVLPTQILAEEVDGELFELQEAEFISQLRKLRGELSQVEKDKIKQLTKIKLLEERLGSLESTNEALRLQLSQGANAYGEGQEQLGEYKATQDKLIEKFGQFRAKLGQQAEELQACKNTAKENDKLLTRLPEVGKKFDLLKAELNTSSKRYEQCQADLTASSQVVSTLPSLQREMIEMKNALLLAQGESEILKRGASKEALQALASAKKRGEIAARSEQAQDAQKQRTVERVAPEERVEPPKESPSSDIALLEVVVDKANLRSGPGAEHSPVMQVAAKTRLTIEALEGDWFRVYTPTGTRAYIRRDLVKRITQRAEGGAAPAQRVSRRGKPSASSKSASLVPFGSVDLSAKPASSAENRALEMLKKGIGKSGNE